MWQRLFITIFCLAAFVSAMAQAVISGVVKTPEGNSMDFVSVIASPANSPKTILASAFTYVLYIW